MFPNPPATLPFGPSAAPVGNAAFRFSGHQTFPFRYGWFVRAARQIQADPGLFVRPDALARLGVGKNMVGSIRHWCLATGLMTIGSKALGSKAALTELGGLLLGSPTPPPPPPPPPPEIIDHC